MNYKNNGKVNGSIHQYNITDANGYLVDNGQTQYRILIPDDAPYALESHAMTFVDLFFEATGIKLEIVTDGAGYNPSGKYISVGETKLFDASGITLNYGQLKSKGFVIKTVGESIVMAGYSTDALSNALYQFMTLIAGYRYLGPDTYILNRNLKEVKLQNYDVIDAPDIEHVAGSYGFVTSLNRYRINGDIWIDPNGERYHNSFAYLPPATYKEQHPEWYSLDGTQICYTARGNEESLKEMQDVVFEVMKEHLIKYPNRTAIQFGIQDKNTFCECAACTASKAKYNGSNAAVVVQFLNTISDRISEWFEGAGSEYKRDLKITFFAYLSTNSAPARYDETAKKYVPIDETVICRDNVCPFFADIRGDYTKSYYDQSSANRQFANNMKAWTSCSKNIFFWTYSTNFSYYLTPYNSFDAMIESYKFAVECGVSYLFDQAQWNGQASTGWSFLKQYMTSRGSWNCNVDPNELYDEFFSEWYSKEAGPIMRELFDEYRILGSYQNNVLGYTGNDTIYHNPLQAKYWSKQTLIRWIERFDDALKELDVYKNSAPDQYNRYYKHITTERVQYTYILLKVFSASMSEEEIARYKEMFLSDAVSNGILYENEHKSPVAEIFK